MNYTRKHRLLTLPKHLDVAICLTVTACHLLCFVVAFDCQEMKGYVKFWPASLPCYGMLDSMCFTIRSGRCYIS